MRRLTIMLICFVFLACHKSQPGNMGTFELGVGCEILLIKVSTGAVLQPLNLGDFPAVTQKPGQQVVFTYTTLDDATTCMDGPVIRLNSIRNY
jgi:hypothetical protein